LDIKRAPPKNTKRYIAIGVGIVAIVAVSIGISQLQPAAPPVERGTLWFDTVKKGMMTRDVNAPGTLEPEYVRNVTALTTGRVEELPVKPGVPVQQGTLLVVMSNPDEDIRLLQNEQSLNTAIAGLASLKTSLHQSVLLQQGNVATMHTHGAYTAIVSGGFRIYADRVRRQLGFDIASHWPRVRKLRSSS